MSAFSLGILDSIKGKLPLGDWLVKGIEMLKESIPHILNAIRVGISSTVNFFSNILNYLPNLVLILLVTLLAWKRAGWRVALFSLLGLLVIVGMDLWGATIETLALILTSTIIAIIIGIPFGIIKSRSKIATKIIEPILDFMQTLPPLAYLIPAVLFFRIGDAPGVIATVIFAMPPAIRLTALGIEQVPKEMVEVGKAFGANTKQLLLKIELPLALPSIMMGINQTIMLSFSMVVIAGFIGAGGLGQIIISGIQRYNLASALEAGIAIVILAIIIDRMTRTGFKITTAQNKKKSIFSLFFSSKKEQVKQE